MRLMQSFLVVLFSCLLLLFPKAVSAHMPGQAPYFKMDGKYSGLYPVQSVFPDIDLPQDIEPETYLINKPIVFEIDVESLKKVVPQEIINKTTFKWKFGDGTTAEGLKNTHTYKKMGTYVLEIYASYTENGETVPDSLIQSVLLHVLPNSRYQLPQPVIFINGMESPRNKIFNLNLEHELTFDASSSKAPSSKIVSYLWGFGGLAQSKEPVAKYLFSAKSGFANAGVRITDANGFSVDADVTIKHDPKATTQMMQVKKKDKQLNKNWVFLGGIGVAVFIIIGFIIWIIKR